MTRAKRTRKLIYTYLRTEGKPTRVSMIKKAILEQYPEATVNSTIQLMQLDGSIRRVTMERDGKYEARKLKFLQRSNK